MMDFKSVVWAPLRGLAAGYNVYDVHSRYIHVFHVGGAATAHTPATLTLLAPLGFLPLRAAWLALVAITISCVWGALWILARPQSMRDHAIVGTLGLLVIFGGFGEFLLNLGDVTGLTLLGVALFMAFPRHRLGIAGVVLMTFVPQTGLPLSLLMARGRLRTLGLGWLVAIGLSIPPLAIALAAEGPGRLVRSLFATVGSVVSKPNRIDAVGVMLGHESLVTALVLVTFVLLTWRFGLRISKEDVAGLTIAVVVVTLLLYHQPYDLVLVGAVVAAAAARNWAKYRVLISVLVVGGAATLAPVAQHLATTVGQAPVPLWRLIVKLSAIALMAALMFAERRRASVIAIRALPLARARDAEVGLRRAS